MKIPRGDGGKPISYGDPSYIYHGVYNPIVWVGEEAYRPRVETLVVRNRFEVFLRLYDKVKNGSRYTIPGGSVDADSTKIEQAENETNEEALFEIKNIYYTGIQYYDRYTPGFNRSGGDSPIEYAGTINDVFVAEYSGPFDKSKVEPKDLDPDIADNGKFYPIGDVLNYLRPEHLRALSDSKLVDNVVRTNILIAMSNGDVKRAVSESLIPDFDVVPPPGDFIYHGSRFEIDVFHPMSIDFGNAKQKPGWSTFCFADPTLALRFGLMRTVQNALGDGCDSDDVKFCCEWNFETNRPYIAQHQAKEIFNKVIGLKFYVYHIQTEGLDIGIGNDIRFPEYTFREDNIRPRFVSTYTIDRALMDANMDYLDLISITGCEEYLYGSEDIKKRHYAAFINRDYARDPAIKKVIKAIDTGELRPGDDVEEYMRTNGFIPEEVSWEELTELSGINTKLVAMTAENLRYHKNKNQTSMLRHVSPPSPTSSGYFLEDSQGNMVGFVVVNTPTNTITALEVVKRYRRLGIGKELLDVAQNRLRAKFVGINKRNTLAIDMYKKWNWEVYREDDSSFYLKAPGITYTMEGYGFLPSTFAAMVPVTEQRLTAADRKKLSDKDYGIPSLRKYPMPDKKHVISAIQYFNKVEPKYETELARNILKKVKEFDMEEVVSVSPDNRFSKYAPKTMLENEDVSMKSSYKEDDVIYQNFERFTSNECNYCLVTGLSGSGKSTLTQKLSEQYDAKWIELDLFTYGVKKWSKEGSVMWSKEYPFMYYMKTRPDLCKLAEKQSKSEWLKVVDNEKENVAFIKFAIEWAKERPDKRYIIEGVQILVFCKAEMLAGEPLILIDRSVARSYRQRLKREIYDWETFIRELKFTPNVMKYYYEDTKIKARFKDEVIESTFIDIDELEPGYGEKSYGTPIDRTIDNVSSRELESRYEKFVVAKYLHHGEYFGYTDWEKSIGEYITKKEYDMGLYYVYGNNNGYPEYIGQILVDSDKNWHWYEAASPMAVTESWNTHDDEKEILIKLVNDLRLWQYGYVYHGHCYTNCDHNTPFTHRYRTLSTPDFEKYKCGTCFDYTAYIYQKMFSLCTEDEEQFMTQCFYIEAVNADGDKPCHTFPIVRLRNGKYYWLEAAWKQIAGTREYNSLQEALGDAVDKFLQSYNLDDYKILCEFVPDNRFVNVDCYTFMRLAGSNTNIRR